MRAEKGQQWERALALPSVDVVASPVEPSELPPTALLMYFSCPLVKLTLLSAEAPALPLLQLIVGDADAPLAFTSEKKDAITPVASEAVVSVRVGWCAPPCRP